MSKMDAQNHIRTKLMQAYPAPAEAHHTLHGMIASTCAGSKQPDELETDVAMLSVLRERNKKDEQSS